MPRQEWPSGEPIQEPDPAEDVAANEARIAEFLETGEAVDRVDAERAINEGTDLVRFCEHDYGSYLADLDRIVGDSETDPGDRDNLCFWKAAAEIAQGAEDPWELEFLANNVLRDFEFGGSPDPEEQARLVSTKARLDRHIQRLAEQVGVERAQQIFDQYRRRLQELIAQYS